MEREPEHEERPARRVGRLRSALRRARSAVSRAAARAVPGPRTRRGAALGAAAAVVAFLALEGSRVYSGFGLWLDVLLFAGFGVLVVLLGKLAFRLIAGVVRLLPLYVGTLGAGALVGGLLLLPSFGASEAEIVLFLVVPLAVLALLGGAVAFVTGPGFRTAGRGRRAAGTAGLVLALATGTAFALWLGGAGTADHLLDTHPAGGATPVAAEAATLAGLPDPGLPGTYPVARLTYGSGTDRRRPEFGAEAALITPTVDGTPFLEGFSDWKADLREAYWGFDRTALPLNGRVWYPEPSARDGASAGPFPLVLIVHGNHNMGDYSDTGYDYLGEHLASRGFVFVSVDQNFLNGHHVPGPTGENDARGWLLLEHLKVWRAWNGDPESPFHGKIDLDRIGLIGHSRGGEAAGHAAAFDRLRKWPDDAKVRFDYDFGVRAVVAIAPSDGQYRPADRRTPLDDVAYLTIQGGHDGDVSAWAGDRQLRRVRFTRAEPRLFKAGVFLDRANHGQFNTSWGRFDTSPPRAWLLNVAPLMDPDEQRRAARTLIGGFLEATLRDRTGYREMFRDLAAARPWLPEGIYAGRYQDGSFRPLADFEEDIDVTTGSVPGAAIRARGLAAWREQDVPLRNGGTRYDHGVYLGWRVADGGEDEADRRAPAWAVRVPAGWGRGEAGAPARLQVDLARAPEEPHDDEEAGNGEEEGETPEPGATPVDLTVELRDRSGTVARLPLSRFGPELRVLPSRFSKVDAIEDERYGTEPEPIFQTYSMPLADFADAAPGFDPAALAEVRLVFDRSPAGVIIVDDVGLAAQ